jgi:hypothetical protein
MQSEEGIPTRPRSYAQHVIRYGCVCPRALTVVEVTPYYKKSNYKQWCTQNRYAHFDEGAGKAFEEGKVSACA